jgi:hypothetical protein
MNLVSLTVHRWRCQRNFVKFLPPQFRASLCRERRGEPRFPQTLLLEKHGSPPCSDRSALRWAAVVAKTSSRGASRMSESQSKPHAHRRCCSVKIRTALRLLGACGAAHAGSSVRSLGPANFRHTALCRNNEKQITLARRRKTCEQPRGTHAVETVATSRRHGAQRALSMVGRERLVGQEVLQLVFIDFWRAASP